MATPDLADPTDFDAADRGFVATPAERQITAADGRVVWDFDDTAFLDGDCPDTVAPSLWRQAKLCAQGPDPRCGSGPKTGLPMSASSVLGQQPTT